MHCASDLTGGPEPMSNIKQSLRILMVDDHPIVRFGIRQMINTQTDLEICAEADSAESALELARMWTPDVALVDLSLAQGSSLGLIRELREAVAGMEILVLSMHDEALYAERALRAGARGYIMKQAAIEGLIDAIRQVGNGRIYLSESLTQRALERLRNPEAGYPDLLGTLTDRELQVLDLIGYGKTTSDIAEQLEVSIKTIETYRSNIKTKLNLKDANDLVRFAASRTEGL